MLYTQLKQDIESLRGSMGPTTDEPDNDGGLQRDNVWETPTYSGSGEPINSGAGASGHTYYWIAGKNTSVKAMRRLLVKEAGLPRQHVSFMGYWR